ncbi:MAG: carboxypeptidase-like regulatory domain-containing protein [Fluviicola sp.]|jgi:hypothetical protein
MKKLALHLFIVSYLFNACSPLRVKDDLEVLEQVKVVKVTSEKDVEQATLSGNILDDDLQVLPYSHISLTNKEQNFNVSSNSEGKFKIPNIPAGFYSLKVEFTGFKILNTTIKLKEGQTVDLEITMKKIEIHLEKPIIYLYPTSKQQVSVSLNYKGELEFTYPKYPKTGWEVTAEPDGKLTDKEGKEYYALFWEGKPDKEIIPTSGFVVEGDKTAEFLEEKLAYLGLNRKEANEFIVYWLPKMEKNAYNLIHFSSSEYEEIAKLTIKPTPETIIRVMMITKPLERKIDFPLQDLKPLKKERKGFTVVEWGGSVMSEDFIN